MTEEKVKTTSELLKRYADGERDFQEIDFGSGVRKLMCS